MRRFILLMNELCSRLLFRFRKNRVSGNVGCEHISLLYTPFVHAGRAQSGNNDALIIRVCLEPSSVTSDI